MENKKEISMDVCLTKREIALLTEVLYEVDSVLDQRYKDLKEGLRTLRAEDAPMEARRALRAARDKTTDQRTTLSEILAQLMCVPEEFYTKEVEHLNLFR